MRERTIENDVLLSLRKGINSKLSLSIKGYN